jgi:hypothetical protein
MSRGLITLFVVLVAAAALPANAQVITSVDRRNPNAASSMVQVQIAPQPLAEGVRPYADRTHVFKDVPKTLIGAQYVLMSNDDKYNPNHELHVTIGQAGTLYLYIDARVGTNIRGPTATANPAAAGMNWVAQLSFADTGMKMTIDEYANGTLDNYYSVFSLQVTPGVIVLKAQNDSFVGGPVDRNMYGVAAKLGRKAMNPVPADGERVMAAPLLQWTAGVGAAFHNLYVGTSPELGQTDLIGPSLSVSSFPYGPDLTPGLTYYWRVDEIEADMTTVHTGDVWTFKAMSITAFDPVPADGTPWVDLDATLSWKPGMDAVLHDLYFGTDKAAVESGAAGVLQGTLSLTAWEPPTLEMDTTYFWRVDEIAADGARQAGPVWSFSTVQNIAISDPNLLGWWKMDEGLGIRAADWSGHGRHAQFANPAPTWAAGFLRGALLFANDGESAVYRDGSFLNGLDALTITAWVKSNVTDTDKGFLIFEPPVGNDDRDMRYDASGITAGGRNIIKVGVTISQDGANTTLQLESSDNRQTTDWQHLTLVWASGQALKLYINGQPDSPTFNSDAALGRLADYSTVIIGKAGKDTAGSSWDGLIDEIRIYNRALTQVEVQATMRSDPLLAWNPRPASGATANVFGALPITWQAGDKAIAHDVYLSDDRAAVSEATVSDATGVYRGRQSDTSYMPTPPPELCVRYFWRIDEVNDDGSISRGFVWDFMLDD